MPVQGKKADKRPRATMIPSYKPTALDTMPPESKEKKSSNPKLYPAVSLFLLLADPVVAAHSSGNECKDAAYEYGFYLVRIILLFHIGVIELFGMRILIAISPKFGRSLGRDGVSSRTAYET